MSERCQALVMGSVLLLLASSACTEQSTITAPIDPRGPATMASISPPSSPKVEPCLDADRPRPGTTGEDSIQSDEAPPEPHKRLGPLPKREPPSAIGDACYSDVKAQCGKRCRVAVRFNRFSAERALARECAPEPLRHDDKGPRGGYTTSACVTNGRIYVTSVCLMCRLADSGWNVTALIEEMTDAQLAWLAEKMGFPKEPLLRTPEAWRAALASTKE